MAERGGVRGAVVMLREMRRTAAERGGVRGAVVMLREMRRTGRSLESSGDMD